MFLHEYLPFFYVILKNIIKTGITLLHMTILLIIVVITSKEPVCPQVELILQIIIILLIIFLGFSKKNKPC